MTRTERLRELVGDDAHFDFDRFGPVVYRHYDANGVLLYVGKTERFTVRQGQHLSTAKWREQIARIEFDRCPSIELMDRLETESIDALKPAYNRS